MCSVLIFVSTRKYIKMEKKTAQKGKKKNYVCMVIRQKVSSIDLDMHHIITSTKIWRLLTTFGNYIQFLCFLMSEKRSFFIHFLIRA